MVSLSFLLSADQAVATVAALEQLQAVGAFPAVARAHLALRQHGLADAGPEVSGAAQTLRAVGRSQASIPLLAWRREGKESGENVLHETDRTQNKCFVLLLKGNTDSFLTVNLPFTVRG